MQSSQKLTRRTLLAASSSAAAAALWPFFRASAASASDYPSRPIRLILPYAPGGAVGNVARLVGDGIAASLKGAVVIDHKPGAGGVIAYDAAAKSPTDGYTLLYGASSLLQNAFVLKKIPYDPIASFEPVAKVCELPLVFAVSASVRANTLAEFVEFAKARGDFSLGTWGIGSTAHLLGEQLASKAQLKFIHTTYRGETAILTDLMGGVVQSGFFSLGAAVPQARASDPRIKLLAVTGLQRVSFAREVPTFQESGFAGLDSNPWHGLFFPAGVPADIVAKVARTTHQVLADKQVVAALAPLGIVPATAGPEEFRALLKHDLAMYGAMTKKFAIEPQ